MIKSTDKSSCTVITFCMNDLLSCYLCNNNSECMNKTFETRFNPETANTWYHSIFNRCRNKHGLVDHGEHFTSKKYMASSDSPFPHPGMRRLILCLALADWNINTEVYESGKNFIIHEPYAGCHFDRCISPGYFNDNFIEGNNPRFNPLLICQILLWL